MCGFVAQLVEHRTGIAEVTGSNPMRWSFFTHLQPEFKYELFHIYFTLFHSSREDMNSIDLAPNVWLHSSVGRASHRYRGGHGFESYWSPDFFRLLLSNCLNWKFTAMIILHSSTTAVQIWIISHILHIYITVWQGKEPPPPTPRPPTPCYIPILAF